MLVGSFLIGIGIIYFAHLGVKYEEYADTLRDRRLRERDIEIAASASANDDKQKQKQKFELP